MIQIPIRIEQIYTVEHDALSYHNLNAHGRQLRPLPASLSLKWQSMVAFPPHFITAAIFF